MVVKRSCSDLSNLSSFFSLWLSNEDAAFRGVIQKPFFLQIIAAVLEVSRSIDYDILRRWSLLEVSYIISEYVSLLFL